MKEYNLYRQKRYDEALVVLDRCLKEDLDTEYAANNYVKVNQSLTSLFRIIQWNRLSLWSPPENGPARMSGIRTTGC